MGDLRADIKIHMNLYGKDYDWESWINYFNDGDGLDRRIKEFFRDAYEEANARYQEDCEAYFRDTRKKDIEKSERDTLALLKAKYEPPNHPHKPS